MRHWELSDHGQRWELSDHGQRHSVTLSVC